ncbi:MAG: SpoIIE family protein phosphatase [Chitinivibrionia bacterium]|nr:SpoIIE family protein phosphatase [Chitinivibrionia bacterium]
MFYSTLVIRNYKSMRLESLIESVNFETEKVNKVIAEIKRSALFFASNALISLEGESKSFGEKTAYEFMKTSKVIVGVGFWYEPYRFEPQTKLAGCYAFINQKTKEIELEDFEYTKTYDYLTSDWYTQIADILKNPYEVVWTRPYIDDSGTFAYMVTASAGVFDEDNTLIALSTVDWDINEIIEELNAIKPTTGSFVILSAPSKDLIISNTSAANRQKTAISELSWDIYADSFELDGVNYMALRRIMDNGWMLSVQIPTKEIFAEMESQMEIFSIILISFAVIILFCVRVFISILVIKPIERLALDIAEVGNGNLDKQIQVKSNDEVGLLAATFNKMTVNLKSSIEQIAKEHAERERIGAELEIATQIQTSMLPSVFPKFANHKDFDIYASMLPAKEIGGDFYDFFFIDANILAVVIADVSGKGIPSALFMTVAKTLIKNNAQSGKSPKEVFDIVNNLLCENNEAAMFVTAFMGYLDVKSGKFIFVNAGHNPPLLRGKEKYDYLKVKSGFVLGGMKDISYSQDEISLHSQDELFLYTDGVTEAMNNESRLFGEKRLHTTVNNNLNLAPKELTETVKQEIDKFADGAQQADDITMLVLRYKGK